MSEILNSGKVWFLDSFEEAGNRPYMDGEIVGKLLKKISSNKTWKIICQLASDFFHFSGSTESRNVELTIFFCLTNRADEEGSARNVSAVNVTYCCPSWIPRSSRRPPNRSSQVGKLLGCCHQVSLCPDKWQMEWLFKWGAVQLLLRSCKLSNWIK